MEARKKKCMLFLGKRKLSTDQAVDQELSGSVNQAILLVPGLNKGSTQLSTFRGWWHLRCPVYSAWPQCATSKGSEDPQGPVSDLPSSHGHLTQHSLNGSSHTWAGKWIQLFRGTFTHLKSQAEKNSTKRSRLWDHIKERCRVIFWFQVMMVVRERKQIQTSSGWCPRNYLFLHEPRVKILFFWLTSYSHMSPEKRIMSCKKVPYRVKPAVFLPINWTYMCKGYMV